ncbi:MAG: NUDIX domain-containing protein [Patescibacteria group bacterium]|nr:NUDIX domain-containing protein [Patescibacteria group bacterium]
MDNNTTVVDENDQVVGEAPVEEAHARGFWHRIAAVYLFDEQGRILVQRRADDGRLDHSAAGHVDVGESYLEAARRELAEELGVKDVNLEEIGVCRSAGKSKHWIGVFCCQAQPVRLEPTEVAGVDWANPKALLEDMRGDDKDQKYTNSFKITLGLYLEKRGLA